MKAIIIAEHSQCGLRPLTDRIPPALLPMAGKPLVMHALESLHRSGIRDVDIIAPDQHAELTAALDTGPLLGMTVTVRPDLADISRLDIHCLIIGLRHIVDTDWSEVLDDLGDLKIHALIPIRMTVCAEPVALVLPPGNREPLPTDWSDVHRVEAIHLPIGPQRLLSATSFRDYHESSFRLLRDGYRHLKPAGRTTIEGHRTAPKARVSPLSIRSDHGYFGAHCRVDKSAVLRGDIIVGERAVIGKGARLQNSIILDHTYVGRNTDCSRSIVDRNLLIRVDTGVCLELEDPVLLGAVA